MLDADAVAGRVPAFTAETVASFWECRSCHHVFWPGPSYRRTLALIGAEAQA